MIPGSYTVSETDAGDLAAASEAKRKATASYLAYRRDGGENHSGVGRIAFEVASPAIGDFTEVEST